MFYITLLRLNELSMITYLIVKQDTILINYAFL